MKCVVSSKLGRIVSRKSYHLKYKLTCTKEKLFVPTVFVVIVQLTEMLSLFCEADKLVPLVMTFVSRHFGIRLSRNVRKICQKRPLLAQSAVPVPDTFGRKFRFTRKQELAVLVAATSIF